MKTLTIVLVVVALTMFTSTVVAQPLKASLPTEVIGTICKTMDEHPAPTPEANYNVMDYAVCGEGGLRVYPTAAVSDEFMKIKKGVQGGTSGKETVYLFGHTRTIVLPSFGAHGGSSGHPRFRFTWLEVEKIRRGMKFASRVKVKNMGNMAVVSLTITNPLNKQITNSTAKLDVKGGEHLKPYTQPVALIRPNSKQVVKFEVPRYGKAPHGTFTIKNYGRVYIDVQRTF